MNERVHAPCLLYAEISGGDRLAVRLGGAEAGYAVERCLNRMSRCAEAYSTLELEVRSDVVVARFLDADSALLAAREMRERVRALPPMSGIKLVLRAGVVLEADAASAMETPEALAAWLVSSQNLDSITVSEGFGQALSPSMRRMLGKLGDQDGAVPFPALELGEAPPPTAAELRLDAIQAHKTLKVSYKGRSWNIDASRPTLLFGRETGNDIVVSDPRVSRQHARIEMRGGLFYLADTSTNGTYLLEQGRAEFCIKRDEFILGEKGHIGCGFSPGENMSDAVAFALA